MLFVARAVFLIHGPRIEHPRQEAGDVVVLPAGWTHLVLNLRESIGVAVEGPVMNVVIDAYDFGLAETLDW